MTNKDYEEVLKDVFGEIGDKIAEMSDDDIEKELEKKNIFITEKWGDKRYRALKDVITENRTEYAKTKQEIIINEMKLEDYDDKIYELTDTYERLRKNLIETRNVSSKYFTVYSAIVGLDYGTDAMELMLAHSPEKYQKLKMGEKYTVSQLNPGVDKQEAVEILNRIESLNKLVDEYKRQIDNLNEEKLEVVNDNIRLKNKTRELNNEYKYFTYSSYKAIVIGKNNEPTDIYIDSVDLGKTLKEAFGANGTGILKGHKLC